MSTLIMTIDSDSDKETGAAPVKPQKKPQKGGKKVPPPQTPIAPEEEDIMVNKDFNLEDITGAAGGPANKKPAQVVDGKYENKMLWSYSDAVKTEKGP